MFIQTDSTVFSATDLINYLGCRHATFLDLADLRQPMLKAESDPTQEHKYAEPSCGAQAEEQAGHRVAVGQRVRRDDGQAGGALR